LDAGKSFARNLLLDDRPDTHAAQAIPTKNAKFTKIILWILHAFPGELADKLNDFRIRQSGCIQRLFQDMEIIIEGQAT
jgi:hypothetical protein